MQLPKIEQRTEAAHILQQLAFGIDPESDLSLERGHILHRAHVIRALVLAVEALQGKRAPSDRPERAGVGWSSDEDNELRVLFERGLSLMELAGALQRNSGGISSRLVRLGLVESRSEARSILKTR